jgi:DNA-binding CsgD family transcriptional regulator
MREGQSGFVNLTDREQEIVRLVIGSKSNDEIAAALGTSRKTVEYHLSRLYERFGILTRLELALRVEREGWLEISREVRPP